MVAVCSGKVRHGVRQDVGIDARKPVKCRHFAVIACPLRLNGVQGVAGPNPGVPTEVTRELPDDFYKSMPTRAMAGGMTDREHMAAAPPPPQLSIRRSAIAPPHRSSGSSYRPQRLVQSKHPTTTRPSRGEVGSPSASSRSLCQQLVLHRSGPAARRVLGSAFVKVSG
jgi:hypothetical protein